jgi:pimeloyl-ACP methyl ester carboxylesterase
MIRRAPACLAGVALIGGMLTGCQVGGHSGRQGSSSSGSFAPSGGSESSPDEAVPTGPVASGAALKDPGAFATSLHFVDISDQVNKAINGMTTRKLSFGRAVMKVPLDWANPTNGKTVSLTVVRIKSASQHDRIGSLVINPGGPGGSGTEAALELALSELPDEILDRFDIVGFDPRGVGLSSPIQCIPAKQKDAELNMPPDPKTDAEWAASIAEVTKVADECFSTYGSDLTFYSTAETVRDMEALRAKLGDAKLTYLGYSYGTLLGAEYASAYPDKVRALVLDGAVDPTINTVDQDKTQAAGFQLAFSHFADACTKGGKCALGSDPVAFVQNLMASSEKKPIPSGDASDKRVVKAGAVELAVISALYDKTQWSQLTTALTDAAKGDGSGVLALDDQYNERQTDGTYTNIEDANAAIACADETDRPSVAEARGLQPQWRASNPLFGGSAASSLAYCSLWKAPADKPIKVTDNHAPTVLVVGTTGDPATPISGAQHLAKLLGSGDLLTWQGDGHTAYPKTKCVTTDVDQYLIDLKAPTQGTTCPAG